MSIIKRAVICACEKFPQILGLDIVSATASALKAAGINDISIRFFNARPDENTLKSSCAASRTLIVPASPFLSAGAVRYIAENHTRSAFFGGELFFCAEKDDRDFCFDGDFPEKNAVRGVYTCLDEYEATKKLAKITVLRLLDEGVSIPFADDVAVCPEARIEPGAVILRGSEIDAGCVIKKGAVIGPDTHLSHVTVGENSRIVSSYAADCVIEENVTVGPFCNLRPGTVLKRGSHAGDFVEIKNSVIGEGTAVAHLTYIGDSDVGSNVNFGCGCVTVNYDGQNKHRTLIGDGCFIGCNVNLVAPVSVENGAYIAAGSTITQNVPEKSLAIARARQIVKPGWAEGKYKKAK